MKAILVCLVLTLMAVSSDCEATVDLLESIWHLDTKTSFNYKTPSPIDIDTSQVKFVETDTPLKLTAYQYVPYDVVNTGHSLEIINKNPNLIFFEGSILKNSKFLYEKLLISFAATPGGSAAGKIDGKEFPINMQAFFRNSNYDKETALKRGNGYAIMSANCIVEGKVPSKDFELISGELKKLSTPGKVSLNYTLASFFWFDAFFTTSHLYAYPGSMDGHDCAIYFQMPISGVRYISREQFKILQAMKNSYGESLTSNITVYPRFNRPVIELSGVAQVFPIDGGHSESCTKYKF